MYKISGCFYHYHQLALLKESVGVGTKSTFPVVLGWDYDSIKNSCVRAHTHTHTHTHHPHRSSSMVCWADGAPSGLLLAVSLLSVLSYPLVQRQLPQVREAPCVQYEKCTSMLHYHTGRVVLSIGGETSDIRHHLQANN